MPSVAFSATTRSSPQPSSEGPRMSDHDLHDRLSTLLVDEPPVGVHLDDVVEHGGRLRLRRRAWIATASAVTAGIAVVGVTALVRLDTGGSDRVTSLPLAATGAHAPLVSGDESGLTPTERRIAAAIRSASPGGWTFDMSADRWDGAMSLEGVADDGTGPGRLMLGIGTTPGAQQVHPCTDPEFRAGVKCVEQTLADGSVLSLRGMV